jgi:NAD(P)-dependent dehydrogenase (short-subunit alcohol dehydrogenase family)
VNAIAPGMSDTEMPALSGSREELLAMGQRVPLGRIGQPEDIAGAVVFLAGPDAGYMTGQTMLVNGGAEMP